MIAKPRLAASCALSVALVAAAANFKPQAQQIVGPDSVRAAQQTLPAGTKTAPAAVAAPERRSAALSAPMGGTSSTSPKGVTEPKGGAPKATKPIKRVKVGGVPPAGKKIVAKESPSKKVTRGALRVLRPNGSYAECPLAHTAVQAEVSGFIARVNVVQTFKNPIKERIEAIYVFPLPHQAAVDSMTMHVGERRIVGLIKRKSVAERIYQDAIRRGATAAVMHQKRPNYFLQKVGNIPPEGEVKIHISYVDVLKYDRGEYAFHFPMTVGPRYTPANWREDARTGGGVPGGEAGAIRRGKSISLSLKLDAGVPIQGLRSINHKKVALKQTGESTATCTMAAGDEVQKDDFDLRYKVIGRKPELAVLAHKKSGGDGHFMLMIQPADDNVLKEAPPREVVFLVDVSGSMGKSGIGHSKMAMAHFLKLARPKDTVQIITFRNTATKCFDQALPCSEENIKKAQKFVDAIYAKGGTEMYKGLKEALNAELDPQRVRIVVMLTDAFIGNGPQIIQEVGKKCGDRIRFWCIGVGPRVNRHLVEAVGKQGGGMSKILSKNESEQNVHKLVNEVVERIHRAQLAAISINWGRLKVYETYPARIPELWHGRPIVIHGRYAGDGGREQIRINGEAEGKALSWPLAVELPRKEAGNDVLATVWARKKIESLMDQIWVDGSPEMIEEVTEIALEHKLMSQYTSFVAVDEEGAPDTDEPVSPPVRLPAPVPMPEELAWIGGGGRPGRRAGQDADAIADMPLGGQANAKEKLKQLEQRLALTAPGRPGGAAGPMKGEFLRSGGFLKEAARRGRDWGKVAPKHREALARAVRDKSSARGLSGVYGYRRKQQHAGRPALQVLATITEHLETEELDRKRLDDGVRRDFGYAWGFEDAIRKDLTESLKSTQKVGAGNEKVEQLYAAAEKAPADQRVRLLQRICLYDAALRRMGLSSGKFVGKSLARIEELREELAEQRLTAEPRLKSRLKILIRDKSLREALGEVATAAGLKLNLAPGAVSVASRLKGESTLRVTFMDVRGATAARAFEWLCAPAHLEWTVRKGTVYVTAASLGLGSAAWTYDVSTVAIPRADEFKDLKDQKKISERAARMAAEFLAAVRKAAGTRRPEDCFWLQPGQIVVFGDAATHARVFRLIYQLESGAGEHGGLGKRASERHRARKEIINKARAARRKGEVYGALYWSSWQLLSAASAGEVDLEALTYLQVAWRHRFAQELAAEKKPLTAMRSAWAVTESALALGKNRELTELAGAVLRGIDRQLEAPLAALEKEPGHPGAYFAALYAYLTVRNAVRLGVVPKARLDSLSGKAEALLTREAKKTGLSSIRLIGKALLMASEEIRAKETTAFRKQLAAILERGMVGDDCNVLAALAARRLGGDTWQAFRAAAREHFARCRVCGAVVLIANRLGKAPLPSAK
jgi:Ca-activated chloride channel family protein